jgi:hypothetical protein
MYERTIIAAAAINSTTPRITLMLSPTSLPSCAMAYEPNSAPDTDPIMSQRTRPVCTVPRRKWMPPPMGFITTAATRSLDTAASGSMPKPITRIGVMSAPPPIPVRPTTKPTIRPANAMPRSMSTNAWPPGDQADRCGEQGSDR